MRESKLQKPARLLNHCRSAGDAGLLPCALFGALWTRSLLQETAGECNSP
jgi:hypothetical protein